MMDDTKCIKCEAPTSGYKCEMCGEESETHDPNHTHGGEHHVRKCMHCNEAQTQCTC